ncbi:MAG: peptidoglycan-associated lipoprotein Pal [Deltaproteobacteria bacterium]|nr:MAG: peptidoglycan-associated lipoprotein Pal [Deltaproteobacteria bacterium]
MTNRMRIPWSVCGIVALFSIAACAPSATNKPDSAASAKSADADASGADRRAGEGQLGGTGESNTGASSLKQMQEGKSPVTPASSPLKDVFYEFDRYDLSADARSTLRANADWLKNNASARVEIEGHCDERGTSEYNLALGAKRAQAAREFLSSLGIPADRLSTISYGQEIPVCREHSEDCWKQNRRARFVIVQGRSTS